MENKESREIEFCLDVSRIGKAALLLSMSSDEEENEIKRKIIEKTNYRIGVTRVAGFASEIRRKFAPAILGAALNCNVINKTTPEVHALLHASLEALNSIIQSESLDSSLSLKVSVVCDNKWICVGIFGDSAFYPITNHEKSSLGIMHIK
ncbi:MAG TPA: HutP family protein [Caldisericia bacterium]|nr:HutP family protein [Caldisericia bacterium]HQN47911.1 HutP family protein [Caldisericia bacterium]HQO99416.1 HutP family protein [Caldisericia bacterium]